MHARTASDIFVDLCEEDKTEPGVEHRCRKLIKSMYGTRADAHDWQADVTRTMKDLGFKQGEASPCVFWHRQRDIKALVHGNDFVSSGEGAELEWLWKGLKSTSETKMTMGKDDNMAKEARVLNRIVRWHSRKAITHEADPRHAAITIRGTGAENFNTISTPAAKETGRERMRRDDLNGRKAGKRDGRERRASFLAQDRMDIAYDTKEATRLMTAPTKDGWKKLLRLGQFFARYPRVVNWHWYQEASENAVECTD